MKRSLIVGFLFLFFLAPLSSRAEAGFAIDSFNSQIEIRPDGRVAVTEEIAVEFHQPLHGIYRDLPVVYRSSDGSELVTTIEDVAVTESGSRAPFTLITSGNSLRIRIGDAATLVSGNHRYAISYLATGVLSSFSNYDELYWNVNGNGWEVPVGSISAHVTLAGSAFTRSLCYVGLSGSTENCQATPGADGSITYSSSRPLQAGEGMTIVAAFPTGTVPILHPQTAQPLPLEWGWLFGAAAAILIIGLSGLSRIWWRKGRDEYYVRKSLNDPEQRETIRPLFGGSEPIGAEYEAPAGLRPGEIGVLMDERADMLDVSASIVDLAVRGYLTITETTGSGLFGKSDYLLTRTAKPDEGLQAFERVLLSRLFSFNESVLISTLRQKFHSALEEVKDLLYAAAEEKKLFVENPGKVRGRYLRNSFLLLVALGIVGFIFITQGGEALLSHVRLSSVILGALVGGGVVTVAAFFFSFAMPKRTAYGREIYRRCAGYRLFVSGTEKYRQPFFENENTFMDVLPYAMVFGVTRKLADAMRDMQLPPSANQWYIGSGPLNVALLANGLDGFSRQLSMAAQSAPSGSGFSGGSSGGGFGGGGGGSW